MPRYRNAWATITGKVFVNLVDLEERLQEKHPHYKATCDEDEDGDTSAVDLCTMDEEKEAFTELAKEALNKVHPTDDPMKLNEVEIDLESYR